MAWHETRRGHYRSVRGRNVWVRPSQVWVPDVNYYLTARDELRLEKQKTEISEKNAAFAKKIFINIFVALTYVGAFILGIGLVAELWPVVTGLPTGGRMAIVQLIAFPTGFMFAFALSRFYRLFRVFN